MGASPYWYNVPYEQPETALKKLRAREFKAGRYYPAVTNLRFPITPKSPSPGAQHKSIKEAMIAADADGTQSILDIDRISDKPEFLAASPVADDQLMACFGTKKPAIEHFEGMARMKLLSGIKRGFAVYFPLHVDDMPTELIFVGYSCD